MKQRILVYLVILTSIMCSGREIIFLSPTQQPVKDVRCIGFSAGTDSIGEWISDNRGIVEVNEPKVNYLSAHKQGFLQKLINLDSLPNTNSKVILSPETDLKEVVVTPKDVEEFNTHTSYRLSERDMARYTNVLQSLNEIPHLTVLTNGGVFYEGNTNVKILIDGVEASLQEVQTLSKEDVAKVNVYRNPPARFLSQGVESVIDIQLKSKIHGGNGGLELSQSFVPLKGDNYAALYYNYRQSRFTVLYGNENSHFKKMRQSEILDYEFGGVEYKKLKEGLDSKNHYDDNSLNLSYQINKPRNFLYHIRSGVSLDRDGRTYEQRVSAGEDSFLATNYLHSAYTKYRIGNYFEKNLGERGGSILANFNYQHYSTKYSSAYDEMREDDGSFRNSYSDYKTHLDAIFSEVQYELPDNKLGYFSLSGFESYKRSKYIETTSPFQQTINVLGGRAMWLGRKDRISWRLVMGASWYRTATTLLTDPQSLCLPTPSVRLSWRPVDNLMLSMDYSYSGDIPNIAQLSETDQWLDTRLVYHGNSTLKPYKTHHFGISLSFNSRYVSLSMQNSLRSSPGMICDMYTSTDSYMLQTLVNLSEYRWLGTQLDISLMPLGDRRLVFWNRVILADIRGNNREYSWHGYRYQWMSTLSLNLDHWTFRLYYQYPGKASEGQLVRPRAQCWSATVYYRPDTNLSVGIEWFMPFGKGFKDSEYTVGEAPVYASTSMNVRDWSNFVSLKLSYNFSFGRNRNSARPQFDNGDNDSGILRK